MRCLNLVINEWWNKTIKISEPPTFQTKWIAFICVLILYRCALFKLEESNTQMGSHPICGCMLDARVFVRHKRHCEWWFRFKKQPNNVGNISAKQKKSIHLTVNRQILTKRDVCLDLHYTLRNIFRSEHVLISNCHWYDVFQFRFDYGILPILIVIIGVTCCFSSCLKHAYFIRKYYTLYPLSIDVLYLLSVCDGIYMSLFVERE